MLSGRSSAADGSDAEASVGANPFMGDGGRGGKAINFSAQEILDLAAEHVAQSQAHERKKAEYSREAASKTNKDKLKLLVKALRERYAAMGKEWRWSWYLLPPLWA